MIEALKGPNAKEERGPSTRNKQDSRGELSADEKLAFLAEKGIRVLRENMQERGHFCMKQPLPFVL